MQKCCITHYLALHGKNVILQLHYNYTLPLPQAWSPLMSWVQTQCDKVCQWLATCLWFSPGTQVSSTNKTDHHDITEILLKVVFKGQLLMIPSLHFIYTVHVQVWLS